MPRSHASSTRWACRLNRGPMAGRLRRRAAASTSSIEEDLIEEVARMHGYERYAHACAERSDCAWHLSPEAQVAPTRVRRAIGGARLSRGDLLQLCCARPAVEMGLERRLRGVGQSALSADLGVMRTSLLPGLVEALRHNRNRQQERVRLFETGLVFAARCGRPVATGCPFGGRGLRERRCRAVGRRQHERSIFTTSKAICKRFWRWVAAIVR